MRPAAGVVVLCGAVLLCSAVSGCGGGVEDAKAPAGAAAESSAQPSAPAGVGDPAAEALETYGAMWVEAMKALQEASAQGTDLERYVTPDVLSEFEKELARLKKDGMVIRGDYGHEPKATVPDAAARPRRATVNDCVDLSHSQPLDITTGWPIPLGNRPLRHGATAELERDDDGRWIVTAYVPDRSRPC
ncbi:hypothetical protein ACIRJR_36410 [Streptomyces sp. NPDC102402]|uniref:hypothetical protein n=1 Tax=Streptomyces sp. NPDC102402 TaxID=3366169 RepID=UPI0037F61EA4